MPKTAPNLYESIAAGRFLALEPVIDGNTVDFQGLRELAEGVNWCIRHLRPQMILDCPRSTVNEFLAISDQAVPANWTDRLVYRTPPFAAVQAAPLLDLRIWGEAAAATTGQCQIITSTATSAPLAMNNTGQYAEAQGTVGYNPAIVETIVLQMRRSAGTGETGIKSFSGWPQAGDNPLPIPGVDCLGYATPEPLATHMRRTLAERLATVLKTRRGCIISWSDDVQNLRKFQTTATYQVKWRLPVWFGPLTTNLRIYMNGAGNAGSYVKFWTETGGYASALTLNPVTTAAWNARTTWQTGLVPVTVGNGKAFEALSMELYAPSGTTVLSGICAWEEPIP